MARSVEMVAVDVSTSDETPVLNILENKKRSTKTPARYLDSQSSSGSQSDADEQPQRYTDLPQFTYTNLDTNDNSSTPAETINENDPLYNTLNDQFTKMLPQRSVEFIG